MRQRRSGGRVGPRRGNDGRPFCLDRCGTVSRGGRGGVGKPSALERHQDRLQHRLRIGAARSAFLGAGLLALGDRVRIAEAIGIAAVVLVEFLELPVEELPVELLRLIDVGCIELDVHKRICHVILHEGV